MLEREYESLFIAWRAAESSQVFGGVPPYYRAGSVPAASPADIDSAVAAARRAFDEADWRHRPATGRA
jgi:acyl-CoA reductase-like NAD-dependent aldehyde dehydrogenase